jgi:CelD/BcsL family acetyltransferase involved in cellulose biosynthesis
LIGDSGLRIERLTTFEQFCALEDQWNTLTRGRITTVFLTHLWLCEWWKIFGVGYELWTLVARRGEDLVGILPLMLHGGPHMFRRLEFMGSGETTPNHLDIIARAEDHLDVLAALASYLSRCASEWDIFELDKLPGDRKTADELRTLLQTGGLVISLDVSAVCPYITLPDTFDAYIKSRSSSTRSDYRRDKRALARDFPEAKLSVVETRGDLNRILDVLIDLHQTRWTGKGYVGAFSSERLISFYRGVARRALHAGILRLCYLHIGENVIAVQYNFVMADCVQGYLGGFDPRWARYAPGILMLCYAVESAITEGARILDLLEGTEAYKSKWATDSQGNLRLRAFGPHWRGQLARVYLSAREAAVTLALKYVPLSIRRPLYQVWLRRTQNNTSRDWPRQPQR